MRLVSKEENPEKLLQSLDSMISQGQNEQALGVIQARLREQPQNWELLYRQAHLLAATKPAEAAPLLEKLLAFNFDDDELAALGKRARSKLRRRDNGALPLQRVARWCNRLWRWPCAAFRAAYEVRSATGLDPNRYYGAGYSSGRVQTWMPLSFGQARMGALAWLFSFAQKDNRLEEYLAAYKKPVDAASPSPRAIWDWIYLTQVRNDGKEFYRTCKLLAQSGEPLAQAMYLYSLSGRTGQSEVVTTRTTTGNSPPIGRRRFRMMRSS